MKCLKFCFSFFMKVCECHKTFLGLKSFISFVISVCFEKNLAGCSFLTGHVCKDQVRRFGGHFSLVSFKWLVETDVCDIY